MKTIAVAGAVIAASVFGLAYIGYKSSDNAELVKKLKDDLKKSKEANDMLVSGIKDITEVYETELHVVYTKLAEKIA